MQNFKTSATLFVLIILINLLYLSCQKDKLNLVEVDFKFNYTLKWDLVNEKFIEDNNYIKIKRNYSKYKNKIILSVLDTTSLGFDTCFKDKIRKGDLSIVLMNSIESIPFSKIFEGSQYDNFRNCKYPMGLFDRIEMDRIFFVKKLESEEKKG